MGYQTIAILKWVN